ncbi:MAG: malto-oligosyltrehalose trehalohydrolase [Acetobacteraceae bacterium]|nr:malto-oligosyltrehalose trehalohydrolase [Acetobacteraceae bacterium]
MNYKHDLPFGATVLGDGTTRFRIWAPSAPSLDLAIDGTRRTMAPEPGGWHSLTVPAGPGTRYQFVMPDGLHFPDPASRMQDTDVHDPSVVVDPTDYEWKNADWRGRPWHECVVYELHPGLEGGFRGVQDRLPELHRLGVTAVELMPISDFPGRHNWGYDGVLPFAPDRAYGTPEELKSLIDTAHGLGIAVFLDVVYNHFGPDGAYIHVFARSFFRDDLHTPWGAAIDFRRPEVRNFFIQNTMFWLQEYRFDGIRFDAVHAISEEDFLFDLARLARGQVEPGRHIGLVVENERNRVPLLGGPPQFDAQWADDFHHCLHVLLTGEQEGYYGAFQDATEKLRRVLTEGFAYQGEVPPGSTSGRGEPSAELPTTAFVMCLQNHDQTGNRAMGERLSVLASPEAVRAATALLLLAPFIPMLFMGEEFASTTPFLFFTDHHDELADAVREGRRSEFSGFSGFQDEAKRARIPDPNAPSSYVASAPERTDPARFDWMRRVIALRHAEIVPGIPGCRSEGAEILGQGGVRANWAMGDGRRLSVAINLGDTEVDPKLGNGEILFSEGDAAPHALGPNSFVAQWAA